MPVLFAVLYAVALCALIAAVFAVPVMVIAAFAPGMSGVVTTRNYMRMVSWGTLFIFAGVLVPHYV